MEKNDFKEMCKCAGLVVWSYNGFKSVLTKVKESIDTRQFANVYHDLANGDAQLFTLLCFKCGINPFNFTNSEIPSRSLYELTIPNNSHYAKCLLDCLYNLPKNTKIRWRSCDIEIDSDVVFNNIANIDAEGLRINALYTEINGNEIFINNDGLYVQCPHLSINCKELYLQHRCISGAAGDLTLNAEEIFIDGQAFNDLTINTLRISKSLDKKYGKGYFADLIDCDDIDVI